MEHEAKGKIDFTFRGRLANPAESQQARESFPDSCFAVLATCRYEPDYLVHHLHCIACQPQER